MDVGGWTEAGVDEEADLTIVAPTEAVREAATAATVVTRLYHTPHHMHSRLDSHIHHPSKVLAGTAQMQGPQRTIMVAQVVIKDLRGAHRTVGIRGVDTGNLAIIPSHPDGEGMLAVAVAVAVATAFKELAKGAMEVMVLRMVVTVVADTAVAAVAHNMVPREVGDAVVGRQCNLSVYSLTNWPWTVACVAAALIFVFIVT
jgi:hypothetical protein